MRQDFSVSGKKRLHECEREELILIVEELQQKLKKKKDELIKAKGRINSIKSKVLKLKATIAYQRKRILELYQ